MLIVLLLAVISSVSEIFSIGIIVPFIKILIEPNLLISEINALGLIDLDNVSTERLMTYLVVFALACILTAAFFRIVSLYKTNMLAFEIGTELSGIMYKNMLRQKYESHFTRDSGDDINTIITKSNLLIYNFILPSLQLVSSGVYLFAIMLVIIMLLNIWVITMVAFMGLFYLFIASISKKILLKSSEDFAFHSSRVIKTIQESILNIREIIFRRTFSTYENVFLESNIFQRQSQAIIATIGSAPRFIIEAFFLIVLVCVSFFYSMNGQKIVELMPPLGAIALGFQRSLPVAQSMFNSWTNLKGGKSSIDDAVRLLTVDHEFSDDDDHRLVEFNRRIRLDNVSYIYPNGVVGLKGISLEIEKGKAFAILGQTGSGKSTLLDVISGLVTRSDGQILVDERILDAEKMNAWRSKMSYVSQSVNLINGTVIENVAFSKNLNEKQIEKAIQAMEIACVLEFTRKMKKGIFSEIGEGGKLLSGGQRQRIAIARAIYNNTDILILDEATSALDKSTQIDIFNNIKMLNKTIICVTHDEQLADLCDFKTSLQDGMLKFNEL